MMKGWFRESYRHSLASRGIKTSFQRRSEQIYSENLPEGQIYMSPSWSPARAQGWPQATHPFPVGASLPDNELELKKLIYAYWNESLKEGGGDFDYQGAFKKMAPFLKKKLAEHGVLTESDFIEAEMDYIRRKRYNELHPDEPVPLTPLGGDIPRYFGDDRSAYQSYGERKRLIQSATDLPAYMPDELPGKPGIWADDFRVVRRKYLGTVGSRGVARLLAEGTMAGEVNTELKPQDYLSHHEAESALAGQYEEDLKNRPLQQDELNYLWNEIYGTNREAHIHMSTFKEDLLPIYNEIQQAEKVGYKDKLKNMELFDSLIHAQHVTGSLLPVDINQMRDEYNRSRAANVRIAKRIDRYAGKKPDKLLFGDYDKAVAAGKEPEIDKKQLQMGIKVEMEHTPKRWLAEKIAKDHLSEGDPLYYTHLKEMEEKYGC